jgi:uncharacterized protein YaiI (UPF0178 family)
LIDVGKILAMRYFMVKIRRAGQETKGTQWAIRLEKEKEKSFRRLKNINQQKWNWAAKYLGITNAKLPRTYY